MGVTNYDLVKYNNINGTLFGIWNDKEAEGLADKHADHWLASKRANLKIQDNYEGTKGNKYSTIQ